MDGTKKYGFSSFQGSQYEPQEERLAVMHSSKKLVIGIPREVSLQENRVALIPNSVRALVAEGHRIIIESEAGKQASFTNHEYSEAGAEISQDRKQVFDADVLVKVAPPTLEEIDMMHADQLLISPLQIPVISDDYIKKLCSKRVIAVAMEYYKDDDGSFPLVRIMSEMAGISAVLTAADLVGNIEKGRGVLLGGISGVPPAKIVILGAGMVAEFATRTAVGLGASVRIFDDNVYKLIRLQRHIGIPIHTSTLSPVHLQYQLLSADVVIGAMHSKTGRTPIVVTEEMVSKMKSGSVIIDVSIDQGGCFETSRLTTHEYPTFIKYDVIHYCVPNLASKIPRTASHALSNILTPILRNAGYAQNIESLIFESPGLRHGIYTYKGRLTNRYLSGRFEMKYTDLELLLTSSF